MVVNNKDGARQGAKYVVSNIVPWWLHGWHVSPLNSQFLPPLPDTHTNLFHFPLSVNNWGLQSERFSGVGPFQRPFTPTMPARPFSTPEQGLAGVMGSVGRIHVIPSFFKVPSDHWAINPPPSPGRPERIAIPLMRLLSCGSKPGMGQVGAWVAGRLASSATWLPGQQNSLKDSMPWTL